MKKLNIKMYSFEAYKRYMKIKMREYFEKINNHRLDQIIESGIPSIDSHKLSTFHLFAFLNFPKMNIPKLFAIEAPNSFGYKAVWIINMSDAKYMTYTEKERGE